MSGFDDQIRRVQRTPGMYFDECSPTIVCAWLQGYDDACEGGLLRGFREWLIVMVGTGNNLSWPALVRDLLKSSCTTPETELDKLFELVIEFRTTVNSGGMRQIMIRYHEWLQRQSWYGPEDSRG